MEDEQLRGGWKLDYSEMFNWPKNLTLKASFGTEVSALGRESRESENEVKNIFINSCFQTT